jgi:hypothetical protein
VFSNWLGSLTLSDDEGNNLKITAGTVFVSLNNVNFANAHAMDDVAWLAQIRTRQFGHSVIST